MGTQQYFIFCFYLVGSLASEFGKPASVLYDSCEGQKTTSSGKTKDFAIHVFVFK
jgi:hypothetical protein